MYLFAKVLSLFKRVRKIRRANIVTARILVYITFIRYLYLFPFLFLSLTTLDKPFNARYYRPSINLEVLIKKASREVIRI